MLGVAIPAEWKHQWDEFVVHFQDPFKLRVTMLSIVAAFGLLGIYRPMNSEIAILRRDLKTADDRLAMIREIESLRSARVKLLENLPEAGDVNFWTEYLLGHIRNSGVNLRSLDSNLRKTKVGKLQGAYFEFEVTGRYDQVHQLLSAIETNKYFARIVKLHFKNDVDDIEAKMTVAVLVAPQEKPKEKSGTHTKSEAKGAKKTDTGKPEAKEGEHGA